MMIMMITMLSFFYDTQHQTWIMNDTLADARFRGSFYSEYQPWLIQDGYHNTRWTGKFSVLDRRQTIWSINNGGPHRPIGPCQKNSTETCLCKKVSGKVGCSEN